MIGEDDIVDTDETRGTYIGADGCVCDLVADVELDFANEVHLPACPLAALADRRHGRTQSEGA